MNETPNDIEQQVENIIRASFAQPGADEPEADQDGKAEPNVIDVDLYRLEGGAVLLVPNTGTNPLDANAVESQAPAQEDQAAPPTETPIRPQAEAEPQEERAQEPEPAPTRKPRVIKRPYLLIPLVLLFILAAGAGSYWYLFPALASATVTITPKAQTLHTETTLTVAASPNAGQVQGRLLEPVSFTRSQTVPATGHGHDDARAATGVITFYNADSTPVTIPAGITFTPQDGVTVMTDSAVTVQAAIPPSFGIGIAPAHVLQAGSTGNIAAHAIYTRCCGSQFITVTNTTPFTGGQDARNYSFIQTSDIQNAANDLLASLTPQATAALSKETQPGEQLVTPLCTPRTTSSQPAGSEGASVTVSVTQQCTSVAYRTDSLNQVASSTLAERANLANYVQAGTVQVTVNGSTYANQTARLNVSLAGLWVYHFTQAQLTQLANQIAGESQEQAEATIEQVDGVANVTIRLQRFDFKDQLPPDPEHITIQLFYIVS